MATPHEVFTPAGALPPGMFATRVHHALERRVVDALNESGRQLALHGWTGVGKTSLLDHICDSGDVACLQVECSGTYEAVMRTALSELDARASTRVVEQGGSSKELKGGPALFSGRLRRERSSEEHFEPYEAPLENLVVDALVEAEIRVMFLDNLEDLASGEEDRRGICRLIKMCSGRSKALGATAPKVVIAGPTAAVGTLLLSDKGADRRTTQIEVPRMSPDEIEQILVRGETKLGIAFDDACREKIVTHADGFPYYAHLYALHASLLTIRSGRDIVLVEDFYKALDEIIEACSGSLKESYSRAVRNRGQAPLRQGVLAALAVSDEIEVTLKEVEKAFLELQPSYERVQRVRFLGGLLGEFQEIGILEHAWREDGTAAYRFRDPLMRVYIRLRTLREQRSEAARWRSSLPGGD